MKAKVRVYGKSQGRTALGIINAYLKLYPDSTLSDLQQAFPKSLNPKSFTDNIIVPEKETKGQEKQFFERENELIVLKNGERLALVEVWSKDDFDAICEHAKQYGIEVAELEETKPFEKGSYKLEDLSEIAPPMGVASVPENTGKKKGKFGWWWIIALILLLLILLFCWKRCCCGDKCSNHKCSTPAVAPIENTTPATPVINTSDSVKTEPEFSVDDTGDIISIALPDGKECKIEKNSSEFKLFTFLKSGEIDTSDKTKGWITLDKLSFGTGNAKLTAESENQLKNVAGILKSFPNSHIMVGGYTDNTGTDEINMRLSSERAKVAAQKLIALGVDANRVTHEGYGSKHPVCPENNTETCRAANRRIDIKVTRK